MTKRVKKELLKAQLEVTGQTDDFAEIINSGTIEDSLIDDSLANALRLMLFPTSQDDEEELMILLTFTREKLHRMIGEERGI